jgi:hypothetical protein
MGAKYLVYLYYTIDTGGQSWEELADVRPAKSLRGAKRIATRWVKRGLGNVARIEEVAQRAN